MRTRYSTNSRPRSRSWPLQVTASEEGSLFSVLGAVPTAAAHKLLCKVLGSAPQHCPCPGSRERQRKQPCVRWAVAIKWQRNRHVRAVVSRAGGQWVHGCQALPARGRPGRTGIPAGGERRYLSAAWPSFARWFDCCTEWDLIIFYLSQVCTHGWYPRRTHCTPWRVGPTVDDALLSRLRPRLTTMRCTARFHGRTSPRHSPPRSWLGRRRLRHARHCGSVSICAGRSLLASAHRTAAGRGSLGRPLGSRVNDPGHRRDHGRDPGRCAGTCGAVQPGCCGQGMAERASA